MYDTDTMPFSYTGPEHIDITNNQISLKNPININDEIVVNPRAYDGAVFDMLSGTDNFAFRQNTIHGGQPIAQFYSSTKICTFHGDCQIPNMYNKTHVGVLIADIYDDTYVKTEIDTLISNTDLSNYYVKAEIDTLFPNIDLSSYYTKSEVDDIDNELSTLILNTYTKTEVDTLLYTNYPNLSFTVDNFYSTTEIDSTLSGYTTSAQLQTDFYSKVKTNLIFDTYTTTTQLYDAFYSKGYVNQRLVQSTTLFESYYTKGDIDTLLADKVSNIGDISLPGMLDIGTPAYTNSRIRCNAEVGGYTGYAESKAASSYDMLLNLSTTRTDGGWMYFKINNDDYIQLPSSDNKVNIYKDTTKSGNLDVGSTGNNSITKNMEQELLPHMLNLKN